MLPCETDVLRNDDDRIFDWIDSEAWRSWPTLARGLSSLICGSNSEGREVGASGMGSVGDPSRSGGGGACSSSSCCCCCASVFVPSSSPFLTSLLSPSPAAWSVTSCFSSAVGVGSFSAGVAEASASASLGVSTPVDFLFAFFFCFCIWATYYPGTSRAVLAGPLRIIHKQHLVLQAGE